MTQFGMDVQREVSVLQERHQGDVPALLHVADDLQGHEIEEDENEAAENFELPGADLSKEELTVHVVPRQEDEFTCSQCFLVHHASQLDHVDANGAPVCTECAM